MTSTIQPRGDTTANWTSANPVLEFREIGTEILVDGSRRLKVGDGTTPWNTLQYLCPPKTNPTGGAENYAAKDAPSFTGNGAIAGNLAVGGTLTVTGASALDGGGTSSDVAIAGNNRSIANKKYVDGALPIGAVQMFAGPHGSIPATTSGVEWLICNGQAIDRTTYAALFTLIGTTYGAGNGVTTFNLPDLRARVPVGNSDAALGGPALGGGLTARSLAATGGAETHTLTTDQIPPHVHTVAGGGGAGGGSSQFGFFATPTGSLNTGSAGTGGAHNNLQPFLALNYIIRAR